MPAVFVIARDWTLRVGVRAELREARIEALGLESLDDLARALAQGRLPSVIVLDADIAAGSPSGPEALANLAKRVPVIVVASRTQPAPAVEGAAAVLYRPVRIGDIVARVQQVLAGQAA